MFLARQIDAAARGRQGAGGPAPGAVTPAAVRFYERRARALRAQAQVVVLQNLFRAPLVAMRSLLPRPQTTQAARPRR